ncbi:hypothetical protein EB796_007656 [Bugula neritina]|uniref:Uncharacterized protein n=1 Tax=Bugula neritina TaxID=10212 RepID=A0A7J7K5Z7_BUGNE|nr:hypothetical protein EB796_007656 [Bugula neritina]
MSSCLVCVELAANIVIHRAGDFAEHKDGESHESRNDLLSSTRYPNGKESCSHDVFVINSHGPFSRYTAQLHQPLLAHLSCL